MTFRSRRLEELLDGTLDAITYADIAGLVGNPHAAEAEDLDYKQAHYTSEAVMAVRMTRAAMTITDASSGASPPAIRWAARPYEQWCPRQIQAARSPKRARRFV
ncbi:hypothetical protein ACFQ6Q_39395 [Streptomyces sp. NPDC056437]|uniref:hypothetical protein n=1 Tax=Streptomyces sp. NPDC056437 TaxID=3345816 RepID=UPI0036B5922C